MASVEAVDGNLPAPARGISTAMLRWSMFLLTATVWTSATLFGLYILTFYAAALTEGSLAKWNDGLPGLYDESTSLATAGIGLHFAAGGVILALGCIQLIAAIRNRYPAVHRWIGRVYVLAAFCAGVGGLTFILVKGTIGGTVMNIGFGVYGVLTAFAAAQAYRHARARRLDLHRAWAIRLFALAIGSWLYRMDYGFWLLLADGAGHTKQFGGPFDQVMAFFFYIPNLVVAEMLIRAPRRQTPAALQIAASGVFVVATGFLVVGTYYFTKLYWGPAIVAKIAG